MGELPPLVFPMALPMLLVPSALIGYLPHPSFQMWPGPLVPTHNPHVIWRTLSGGEEEGREHEGQRPPSDRLINRALGCVQLTLGMTLVEGGGGVRSMGSHVPCREKLARLRMQI